jgi:hypothetical protein
LRILPLRNSRQLLLFDNFLARAVLLSRGSQAIREERSVEANRESGRHGLKSRPNARIDLPRSTGQLRAMAQRAIPSYAKNPIGAAQLLLARATQARRIALTLSKADAEIAEAYAAECEAEARRLLGWRSPPMAA